MTADKQEKKSNTEGKKAPTTGKVVIIRRLPPGMTEEELKEELSPLPQHIHLYLSPSDYSWSPWVFSRAYIHIRNSEDILTFRDRFNGYVFVDSKGNEYPVMVELAPNQKIPKTGMASAKKDSKCGLLEEDADYQKFVEELENPVSVSLPTIEAMFLEIEKRKESKAQGTPLTEFIKQRREEKFKKQQEKRKQKEDERKRREEERKRKIEKEKEQQKKEKERQKQKEKEQKESRKQGQNGALQDPRTDRSTTYRRKNKTNPRKAKKEDETTKKSFKGVE